MPTHTLHQWIEPHDGKKNDYTFLSTHSTTLFSSLFVHPHVGAGVLLILTHRIFLVLLTQFSSTDFADGVGVYFPHSLICGFAVVSLTLCFVGVFFTFWGWKSIHFHAQASILLISRSQEGSRLSVVIHIFLVCFPSIFSGSGVKISSRTG